MEPNPNIKTYIRIRRGLRRVDGEINCMFFEASKEYEKNYPTRDLILNNVFVVNMVE